jgi:succinate dehydrogenase / fumarate reductase iron-sulfur subunit
MLSFHIDRYDPDQDARPRMQVLQIEADPADRMRLDVPIKLKAHVPSLSFRRSCREGVFGSDGMNINGKNGLASPTCRRCSKPSPLSCGPGPRSCAT